MRRIFTWPVVYFYSLLVIVNSLLPLKTPVPLRIAFIDKYLHAIMYLVLAWLLINTLIKKDQRHPYAICFCYAFFLGLGLECIQYFLPYRSFEAGDILANSLGTAAGMLILTK